MRFCCPCETSEGILLGQEKKVRNDPIGLDLLPLGVLSSAGSRRISNRLAMYRSASWRPDGQVTGSASVLLALSGCSIVAKPGFQVGEVHRHAMRKMIQSYTIAESPLAAALPKSMEEPSSTCAVC